ncbi:HdeD family acid-resistance protein [Kineosporia sp. A_224]|uniref:HdeD family acid-resistance protein n=1 Tax=Kineosporia sp. A_224 TaxID=1962180 RepID=UPI000B4B4D51|nr:HdeD family acid-resistance protein [Kineosporia sp. A_224]
MTERTQTAAPVNALAGLGRHWGLVLAVGLVNVGAGVLALTWPGITLVVAAVLFGIQLIATGLFRLIAAFSDDAVDGGVRALLAVLGILSLVAGVYAVRHLLVTLTVLVLLLGIFWFVNGVVEVVMGLVAPSPPGRAWQVGSGVLSVLAGVVVLAYPELTLVGLAVILGVWLLAYGIVGILVAVRLRSYRHDAPAPFAA